VAVSPTLTKCTVGAIRPGFNSWAGPCIFLFIFLSRPALEPTRPLIQWVPSAFSSGVKLPDREAVHSPPCSVEAENI
jgi:hypothetical protein